MASRSVPDHIAIIMDGNRRWAAERGKASQFGHEKGSSIVEDIARTAYDEGTRWLTLFAFSTENWKRSSVEIMGLMTVLRHYLKNNIPSLMDQNIRLKVIGDQSDFPQDIITLISEALERTKDNTGLVLTIALGYGGRKDIATAAQHLAEEAKAGKINPADIDENMLKTSMDTSALPPVDLLIRTGKEKRISNFLLWDSAYAELVFSDTYWPEFTTEELQSILDDYTGRTRRFGGGEVKYLKDATHDT